MRSLHAPSSSGIVHFLRMLSVPSCRMPAIAGKDVDRRLCPHRVAHVTAAPPQAVTMTPAPQAMATTKFRTLAHRSDGRRHLPRQHRQHHASKRLQSGHPSRRCPAAPLSKTTRTTALTNGAAQDISRTPPAANNALRQTQASKPAARRNEQHLPATPAIRSYRPGSRTSQPESFGHRPSRFFGPNVQHRPPSLRRRSFTVRAN